jgi:hypothetical protein
MEPDVKRFWSTWKARSDTFSPQEREAFFQAAVRQLAVASKPPMSIRELTADTIGTAFQTLSDEDTVFLQSLHIRPW